MREVYIVTMKVALCLGLLGTGGPVLADGDELQKKAFKEKALYENAERTEYVYFKDKITWFGDIEPAKPVGAQGKGQVDSGGGEAAHDCSNSTHRCVQFASKVIAVPVTRLRSNSHYEAAGALFEIVRCIRGYDGICQVALVKSLCSFQVQTDRCVSWPGAKFDRINVAYFIYNEDFGVTSFGTSSRELETKQDIEQRAREYVLQGDAGILRAPGARSTILLPDQL